MKEELKKRSGILYNLIITVAITLFFLGVIIAYYASLYSQTRDNIILNGELNAVRSANQIDRFLYTGMDAIQLTGYTLDNMIRDRRSQPEIQAYLENQSFATAIVVARQSNGIYGLINGEYMDGSNWVPDADYVPTERPWYIEAMAHSGKVAVIDPYLDAQTQSMIITFAKTLCDAKSVVAIDVSMEQLQTLTEGIAAQDGSGMEIILDRNYQVIAHSDRNEVGKRYADADGSLGGALAAQLRKKDTGENYSSLRYGSAEYIIYAMAIENSWLCVSVIDATAALARLRVPLILTILVSALIIGILLFLMLRSIRKDALAEKMKKLADQQTEYAYFDQMTGLKNRRAYAEAVERLRKELPRDCCVVVFDVNGLKKMNDSRGHEAGDELLTGAANCIRAAFPDVDAVYRTGGDEFCVILTDTEERTLRRLQTLDQFTADWHGRFVNGFSVSYGVASRRDAPDIDAIVKEADQRMYEYKERYYARTGQTR